MSAATDTRVYICQVQRSQSRSAWPEVLHGSVSSVTGSDEEGAPCCTDRRKCEAEAHENPTQVCNARTHQHARERTRFQKPGAPVNLPHTSALTASLFASLRFAAAAAASAEPPVSAAPATQHTSK